MNYATHKISLDIHKPESQTVLHMKRTDTGRKIKISLTEDGRPYILTPDCSAVFKAKKPDGHDIKMDCEIDGNVIIYPVSFQTTAMLGEVECEIMLFNESGMLITSPRFVIIVNDTVQSEGSIAESDSEASIKFNELLKSKLKTVVEEYFEQNPVSGVSEEQKKNIEENVKARHSHENADVLENLSDNNGTLTYNNNPIGGSGSTERPTAEYVYDFVEDYRMTFTRGEVIVFTMMIEEATEIENTMMDKEIVDVEFQRSNGEWVSVNTAWLVDSYPCIPMLKKVINTVFDGTDSLVFSSLYCPMNNWIIRELEGGITKMRVTYYTD
jgi:hypothetical protein